MTKTYKESMSLSRQDRFDLEYSLLKNDKKLLVFIEEFILMLVEDYATRFTPDERKSFEKFIRNQTLKTRDRFLQSQYYLEQSMLFTIYLNLRFEDLLWDWEDTQK